MVSERPGLTTALPRLRSLLQRNEGTFSQILHFAFLAEVQMAKPWTSKDIETLRTLAQRRKAADIAAELGRSMGSTAVKAHQLGISLRFNPEVAARLPKALGQHSNVAPHQK